MAWFLRRIALSVVLIWIVTTIIFSAVHLVPGDPAEALLSEGGVAPDPAAVAALRQQLGLNRPILQQYLSSMLGLLHFNLGRSLQDQSSVAAEIARRLPLTLELIAVAAVIAIIVGVFLGTLAALRPRSAADRLASLLAAGGLAVPVFVVGPIFVLVFAERLRWLPASGYAAPLDHPLQHIAFLTGPAITLSLGLTAAMIRISRASVLDVIGREFVRTARAKGLAPRRILLRHVLRNALIPVVTVLALNLGSLLGGTVLVEYVFAWPGLSSLLINSVSARDYPEVVGVVLVLSVLLVLLNLIVDLLYAALDPRVRLQ